MTEEKRLLLSEVCQEYFGITDRIAQRKASMGLLPVPAFRLSGTRKGPLYVLQSDLDAHVKRQYEEAQKLNSQMRRAGLV
ncbi:pyocin activator PrtN family protein [uncultured Rhodoferax sp.]|uniref:pyocin activator PrtN family protein n=1 Tax=uncultured Rhodoferax sp. TaxID=223188 RepID=UPI0025D28423|nr:pyocin activator PrtN family protein [uncultured Rhodoferax sp.]